MIYGVKCSRKVEKAEAGDLFMAYCCNEVVMLGQKCIFGGVIFGIGRFISVVQEVRRDLTMRSVILETREIIDIGR